MFDDEDEVDENDMVLEHGALEETLVDLETGIHFYQLQVEIQNGTFNFYINFSRNFPKLKPKKISAPLLVGKK